MKSLTKGILNKIRQSLKKVPLVGCALHLAVCSLIFTAIPVGVVWAENIILGFIPQSSALDNPIINYIKFISVPTIFLLCFISLMHDFMNFIEIVEEIYTKLNKEFWFKILVVLFQMLKTIYQSSIILFTILIMRTNMVIKKAHEAIMRKFFR